MAFKADYPFTDPPSSQPDPAVIYLDHNATTPVEPVALAAMLPFLRDRFGNASSRHEPGRFAAEAVELARRQVARLAGASPSSVVFTGGATEAINLAIKGICGKFAGGHLVTQATEHPAGLDACEAVKDRGFDLTVLPVDGGGRVAPSGIAAALRPETRLVSVMWANNETGVLQPVTEIAAVCREAGVPFHCDATQAAGKIPLAHSGPGASPDLLSLSAHKLGGPQGVGALIDRTDLRPEAQVHGGGQERGRRAGTLNVAGIVGFGAAADAKRLRLPDSIGCVSALRDGLERRLSETCGAVANGTGNRLPNTANLSFLGVDAESLLLAVPEVVASTGAACSSASLAPSHVLSAMGLGEDRTESAVRFSLGDQSSAAEVDRVAELIAAAVGSLRSLSTL